MDAFESSKLRPCLDAHDLHLLTWGQICHNRGLFDLVKKGVIQPSSLRQECTGLKKHICHVRRA